MRVVSTALQLRCHVLQQEYEAEQEYIKTLSYLSTEEQRKYKERQSVSFMYQKPPGMDCAVAKPKVCLLWPNLRCACSCNSFSDSC